MVLVTALIEAPGKELTSREECSRSVGGCLHPSQKRHLLLSPWLYLVVMVAIQGAGGAALVSSGISPDVMDLSSLSAEWQRDYSAG